MKKRKAAKVKMCPCGHEESWHTGANKECVYGHDHAMGGCKCLGFRSRRYGTGMSLMHPMEETPMPEALRVDVMTIEQRMVDAFHALDTTLKEAMILFQQRARDIFKNAKAPSWSPTNAPVFRTAIPATFVEKSVKSTKLEGLNKCASKILRVLAMWSPRHLDTKQICIIAGYRPSGGTSTAFATLRRHNLIEGTSEWLSITSEGRKVCGPVEPLPKGADLLAMWLGKLNTCTGKILSFLYENYPNQFTTDQICDRTGYKQSGGTSTAFATLRALDLIASSGKVIMLHNVFGLR